jgi:stage II sporulation protein AA (anti-sigma F factor antagonist)
MRITQRTVREATILDIADEVTYSTRKEFSERLEQLRRHGCRHVILNLKQVTFVDSAAIGLLALAAPQFKAVNCKLSLVGPQGTVQQVLGMAHITKLIPVYPSEDAAMRAEAA